MDSKEKLKISNKCQRNVSSSSSSYGKQEREFEKAETEIGRKEDPLTSYREKEPMTPAKIKDLKQ